MWHRSSNPLAGLSAPRFLAPDDESRRPFLDDDPGVMRQELVNAFAHLFDDEARDAFKYGPLTAAERLAFAQRVHPLGHRSAAVAPEKAQQAFRRTGRFEPETHFLAPDGLLYERGGGTGESIGWTTRRRVQGLSGERGQPTIADMVQRYFEFAPGGHRVQRPDPVARHTGRDPAASPPSYPGPVGKMPPSIDPDAHLEFDGSSLKWIENGETTGEWPGVSGEQGYQSPEHQSERDRGPIPEGGYIVRRDRIQNIGDTSVIQRASGYVDRGPWPGGEYSWGTHRVWVDPDKETDTYGRDNFSIHGGAVPGSAGCIDLTRYGRDFIRKLSEHGNDLRLNVRYPQTPRLDR